MGKCWEFFAGGNTPQGFFSYYDHIMPVRKAQKIICIKGGPGTGKSTLMKKAAHQYEKNYDVELMHCSSDPDSLDGVVVPRLGLAIIDGTAPHVVDPKNPGGIDSIFNAGDFWCEEAISAHRDDIVALNEKIANGYKTAYYYLNIAGKAMDHIEALKRENHSDTAIASVYEKLKSRIPELREPVIARMAPTRKLFLKAITPKGIIDYSSILRREASRVYTIKAYHHAGGSALLHKIDEALRVRGIETVQFYSPFCPQCKMEHLYVESMDALFSVCEDIALRSADVWDLDEFIQEETIHELQKDIDFDKQLANSLLEKVVEQFEKNKKWHDELEMCYIPYIDFEKLTNAFMKLLP